MVGRAIFNDVLAITYEVVIETLVRRERQKWAGGEGRKRRESGRTFKTIMNETQA